MGLFRKKKADPVKQYSEEQMTALRGYVDSKLSQEKQKRDKLADSNQDIRYSLTDLSYNKNGVTDMRKFMNDARQDTAMFSLPALQKTYHAWEKKTAVRRTFSSEIMRILQSRNIKPAEFYKTAEIDKRVFHSMKSDYMYKPSKDTAFRCCAGLRLSYEDTSEMLKLAGYSLSPSDSRELVLRFCLENKIFDIYSINCMLNAMGEKELR